VIPPKVSPNDTQIWWKWTQEHVAHVQSKIESDLRYEVEVLREAVGQALGMKCREVHDAQERETDFLKREIEQLRRTADVQAELQREREKLREEIVEIDQARMQFESDMLRRELDVLRDQLAIERGLQALKAEIAAARADVPRLPDIEERVEGALSKMSATQAALAPAASKALPRPRHRLTDQASVDLIRQLVGWLRNPNR
jgi:hypothetical protein